MLPHPLTQDRALRVTALCALLATPALHAQATAQNGTLTGRVINAGTGEALVRARIQVLNTSLEAFTDEYGQFTLNVPAGSQKLRVSFTGMPEATIDTEVLENETTLEEIKLKPETTSTQTAEDGTVILSAMEIKESRETNAFNIAANEQRYSPNIKSVVSADAFGDVTEGNIGEFIKYLPGISVDYVAADVRTINVRGFSSAFTNLSVNGMRITSSVSGSNNRAIELEQLSINNVARAEVVKVPTPDSPADSLGGNVNLVSKNAFERKGAALKYKAYFSINSEDLTFKATPGPKDKNSAKILPGVDFDLTLPITKDFGIVVTGLSSNQFNEQHRTLPTWNFAQAGATEMNPYLQSYTFQDGPKVTYRNSINIRSDWRISPGNTLTVGYQNNFYKNFFGNRNVNFNAGTTATSSTTGGTALSWDSDTTEGATGRGSVTQGSSYRAKNGQTQAVDVYFRHKDAIWEIDAGIHGAYSKSWYRDLSDGHWSAVNTSLQGVSRVRYDQIAYPRPAVIQALNSTGTTIDWANLGNYRITTVRTAPLDGYAKMSGALGNVKRSFEAPFRFALKTGFTVRQEIRDNRRFQADYTHVGADGVANTADDAAAPYNSDAYTNIYPHYGLPGVQWASPWKLANLFYTNPSYFTANGVASSSTNPGQAAGVPAYIFSVQNSIRIKEDTLAAYLQFESKFLNNRLGLVTGVRFEETRDDGFGFRADPDAIYQRNANGSFTLDTSGKRVRKAEAGPAGTASASGTMMTMQEAQMIYVERGYQMKTKNNGYYPSLHLNYDITDNLIARFAYAKTFGRPDFADIVPNTTIDENETYDPNNTSSSPGVITTANTGLKPWSADNYDLSLEYYYAKTGMVSAGVFRKDIADFWGNVAGVTLDNALAQELGLDPRYIGWRVTSKKNVGDAKIEGFEFNLVQPLTFLGSIGKHLNLTGNATFLDLKGSNEADFKRFIDKTANVGLTWNKYPLQVMVKVNFRGEQRWDPQTGTQYQATSTTKLVGGTFYEYDGARTTVDLNVDYSLSKKLALFVNVRNLTNVAQDRYRYNLLTPSYARNYNSEEYGLQWAVGVKGNF